MKVTGLVPELRSLWHSELTGFTNVSRNRSRSPASSSAKIASLYCFNVAALAFCQNAMARFCGAKQLPICQKSRLLISCGRKPLFLVLYRLEEFKVHLGEADLEGNHHKDPAKPKAMTVCRTSKGESH